VTGEGKKGAFGLQRSTGIASSAFFIQKFPVLPVCRKGFIDLIYFKRKEQHRAENFCLCENVRLTLRTGKERK